MRKDSESTNDVDYEGNDVAVHDGIDMNAHESNLIVT